MAMTQLSNPKAVAERGEKIYDEKYRTKYEVQHLGKFVVIDVSTQEAYLGDSPEAAFELARQKAPHAIFHLIKVGSPGAFRVSYTSNADVDWVF